MDSQAPDRDRRFFLLASAVAASGAVVALIPSCEQPQGLKRPRNASASQSGSSSGSSSAAPAANTPTKLSPRAQAEKDAAEAAAAAEAEAKRKQQAPTERPIPPTSEPAIRIKSGGLPQSEPLAPSSSSQGAKSRVRIEGPGPSIWIIEPDAGRPGTVAAGPVDFEWTTSGWKVTELAGTREAATVAVPPYATLEIMALRNEPQQLRVYGSDWPGKVRLVLQRDDPREPVDIVHEVPMETYLAGVIAKELFNGWGVATHRAQTVAARSYALCEMAMWKGRRHYDVVAGEQSQAWIGTTKHERSLNAVAHTRGQVLLFDSRVVPAYYSSCCGGERAAARDAISGSIMHDIAPLSVTGSDGRDCCSWAPTYRWKSRVDLATFARALPAWARNEGYASLLKVDGVRRVDLLERNAAGRPVRFRITDAKGASYEVTAERLRWALNADPRDPALLRPSKDRVKSANFEALIAGRELVLAGRGHGHGVGMCQYGAEAMSKKGAKEAAILSRFYPGAKVVTAYT